MGEKHGIVLSGTGESIKKQLDGLKKSIVRQPDALRDYEHEREILPDRLKEQYAVLKARGVFKNQRDLGDKYLEYYHGDVVARDDSSQIIRRWMERKGYPSSDRKISCLAKALQCDADYLLGYSNFPTIADAEEYHRAKYGMSMEEKHAIHWLRSEGEAHVQVQGNFISDLYDSFNKMGIEFNPESVLSVKEYLISNPDGADIEDLDMRTHILIQRCDHNRDESQYALSDKDYEHIIYDMSDYLNYLIMKYGVRLPDDISNYTNEQIVEYCDNEREKHS